MRFQERQVRFQVSGFRFLSTIYMLVYLFYCASSCKYYLSIYTYLDCVNFVSVYTVTFRFMYI
jgi:hypothetical protein